MFLTIFVLEISEISSRKFQIFLEHLFVSAPNNSEWFSLNGYFLNGDINVIFELLVFYLGVALAN